MITRVQNWESALFALIDQRVRTPFAWGAQDCCQFARRAMQTITGIDPAKGWGLRRYRTARGAANQLRRLGGLEKLPERAGLQEIALTNASRGDIVLVPTGRRVALGVCVGQKSAAPGKDGLEFVPTLLCVRAWRI